MTSSSNNHTLMGPPPLPSPTHHHNNQPSTPKKRTTTPPARIGNNSHSTTTTTATAAKTTEQILKSQTLEQLHPATHLRRKRLFASIFPPSVSESTPTPADSFAEGEDGGGGGATSASASTSRSTLGPTGVRDWEATWHIATTFLSFPADGFMAPGKRSGDGKGKGKSESGSGGGWREVRDTYLRAKKKKAGPRVEDAMKALLEREKGFAMGESGVVGQSLVEWYTWEVRRHYLTHVRPGVVEMLFSEDEEGETDGAETQEDDHDAGGAREMIVDEVYEEEDEEAVKGKKAKRKLEKLLEVLRAAWEIYVCMARRWVIPRRPFGGVIPPLTGKGARGNFFSTPGRGAAEESDDTQDDEDDAGGADDDDDESDDLGVGGDDDGEGEDIDDDPRMAKFVRSLNAIISYSLPDPQWSTLVYRVFMKLCGVILNSHPGMGEGEGEEGVAEEEGDGGAGQSMKTVTTITDDSQKTIKDDDDIIIDDDDDDGDLPTQKDPDYYGAMNIGNTTTPKATTTSTATTTKTAAKKPRKLSRVQMAAQSALLAIWNHLQVLNLGGGGRRGERVFAEVINVLVTRYIEVMYAQQWSAEDDDGRPRDVMREIGNWVENDVGPLVRLVLVGDDDEDASREKLRRKRKMKKRSKAAAAALARRRRRHGKEKALSPRASFRALELGIGGGSLKRSAATRPRISIDGVMMGESRRIGEMIMMEGLGRSSMRSSLAGSNSEIREEDEGKPGEEEDDAEEGDVADVVLRKEDIEGWKKMALGRLGRLRVGELFDIMVDWPYSLGGIMDLRSYISTPQTRLHLTASFTAAISTRILHPAASTTDILRLYISIIRAFSVLDPRGVLLDRVTRGIRRYLREREDTVQVIVRGLMGGNRGSRDGKSNDSGQQEGLMVTPGNRMEDDELGDLAEELIRGSRGAGFGDPNSAGGPNGGDELDFDDLSWVPDPVDAGPEYRKVKGTDVIGSLMSLYESKEVFVREFQTVLAERLLECREKYKEKKKHGSEEDDDEDDEEDMDSNTSDDEDEDTEAWRNYEPEIQTLELLRVRFGEGPLQACDVMLRDIQVGQRTDANVRRDQHLDSMVDNNAMGVQFHAKILSHLFWPQTMRDEVVVPPPRTVYTADGDEKKLPWFKVSDKVRALQRRYEVGFGKLNAKRVLEWRDLLGSVKLELELEDRVVKVDDASTWAVAVVEAFEEEEGDRVGAGGGAVRVKRSVKMLKEKLGMDEALVRRALGYWREKGVLRELGGDEWVVVESLSDLDEAAAAAEKTPLTPSKKGPGPQTGSISTASGEIQEVEMEIEEEEEEEAPLSPEKVMYAQFIVGMLTNAPGPMPLERIVMMLGMLVPGGLRCGVGEMGELLERMAREGKVELVGGGWKIRK